ncbi:hypothetical protein N0V90_004865 [Kalmusia sp. IMI 367209]|nr:hypothetical protein N0V90_004865 [Kalmusia sp. IMI 367209]
MRKQYPKPSTADMLGPAPENERSLKTDEGRIAKRNADTVSIAIMYGGERRKTAHDPSERHDSDNRTTLDASNASSSNAQQLICLTSQPSFQDYLFHPTSDNKFSEPSFFDFENMLLLETQTSMREESSWNFSTVASLPSPYKNHLTVRKLSFYAARIQNALHMGLPVFLAQKEDDISPWYWHTQFELLISSETVSNDSNLSTPYEFAVQRPIRRQPCFCMSDAVIPDLLPTPLQRSHAHGMYLDMIPFPVFRDRAITLLSMDPPAFDETELKRDIENEGMMVWGVGHGSTGRAASLVRDKRNWECARWFYNKWKLLVDGSGLDEQSQWWRSMRGEDDSDIE